MLTRAFIPIDIQAVITGTDFASNIYEYIPLEKLNIYPDFLSGFEFNLSNSMLDPFGINYESTIVNSYSIFASLVFMIILHLCIILLKWLFSKWKESRNCCYKFLNRAIEKFLIIMTFGYYIRNALEISQFILISSVNEIHESNTSETLRLTSFIFAIIMVISYFAILGIINYLIFTNYKIDENAHNKLEEFFGWLQENKKSRFYVTMLLLRRLLFVTLLITLTSISSRQLIGILMFLQFVYGAYVVYIRPYKDTKSNIIEIINEVYFSLFLVTLMILNTEDVWTTFRTNIYVWILVSNSLIVFLIVFSKSLANFSIVYSIKTFISWLKSKCEKSSVRINANIKYRMIKKVIQKLSLLPLLL